MIVILSPTKNMHINLNYNYNILQQPNFKEQTLKLHSILKNFQPFEIESLMKVNSQIALKTFINFQEFCFDKLGTPAILAYNGLAFKSLNSQDFSEKELDFANNHLRILSGFYGVLKAYDNILPYRLEMNCKLKFENYKDLYDFWKDLLYKELFKNSNIVINLASDEYSKVITNFLTKKDYFINIKFLTYKNGKFKVIPTNAKVLRGKMARFIIKNKIQNTEDLKNFSEDNFYFDENLSTNDNYIFKNF